MSADGERLTSPSDGATPQGNPRSSSYDAATIRKLNSLTSSFYVCEAASFSATRQAPWHGWERAWDIIAACDPSFADRALRPAEAPSLSDAHGLDDAAGAPSTPLAVLDLACGNLRFERFLAERATARTHVAAFDNCPNLASPAIGALPAASHTCKSRPNPANAKGENFEEGGARLPEGIVVEFHALDIVEALLDGTFADRLPHSACDVAVAFGLMHHLPTFALRARVLKGLAASLKPGGFAIVSFWQFLSDPRLAAKAAATTAEGRAALNLPAFQENDFLLGWQHAEGVYRFCHHTPEAEIDALLTAALESDTTTVGGQASGAITRPRNISPSHEIPLFREISPFRETANFHEIANFREIARFSADGKQGNLNRYLVLQRL